MTFSSRRNKRLPKKAVLRPNKSIREKVVKRTSFAYEVKLVRLDQTSIGAYGKNSATPAGSAAKRDLEEALATLRQIAGGRFKIVVNETVRHHQTTVLLEHESDVILLTMLASHLIYRVYKLAGRLDQQPIGS